MIIVVMILVTFYFHLQAYEVVHCRLYKTYDRPVVQMKFPVQLPLHQDPTASNITVSNGRIKNSTHTLNINEQQFFIKFLSRCPEGKNSSCVRSEIPKVFFPKKKKRGKTGCPTTEIIDKLIVISHLLLAINSSANVIIYMLKGM